MADLDRAKIQVEAVRFSDDMESDDATAGFTDEQLDMAEKEFRRDYLRISPQVTPKLHNAIEITAKNLHVPLKAIAAFVIPSPELQATCIGSLQRCLVTVSSSLVELLSDDEMKFVVGHEIGHFLLRHGDVKHDEVFSNIDQMFASKYKEISADRVGLIACEKPKHAVFAMMKIASGLSTPHLRFRPSEFISQIDDTGGAITVSNLSETHPSWYFRSQAILWQDMKDKTSQSNNTQETKHMDIDAQIRTILEKLEGGNLRSTLDERRKRFKLWKTAIVLIENGRANLPKAVRKETLDQMLGEDSRNLLRFIGDDPNDLTLQNALNKLEDAETNLGKIAPKDVKRITEEVLSEVKLLLID